MSLGIFGLRVENKLEYWANQEGWGCVKINGIFFRHMKEYGGRVPKRHLQAFTGTQTSFLPDPSPPPLLPACYKTCPLYPKNQHRIDTDTDIEYIEEISRVAQKWPVFDMLPAEFCCCTFLSLLNI